MDYFDSNLKDQLSGFDNELPKGMAWEDMKPGIYGKMKQERSAKPWKWFSLILLLLIAGCGSWMAIGYMQEDDQLQAEQRQVEQEESSEAAQAKEHLTADKSINLQQAEGQSKSLNQYDNNPRLAEDKLKSGNNTLKNNLALKPETNTNASRSTKSQKPTPTIVKSADQITTNNNRSVELADEMMAAELSTVKEEYIKEKTPEVNLALRPLSDKPSSIAELVRSKDEELWNVKTSKPRKPRVKKSKSLELGALWIGIAAGINNWSAITSDNANQNYISGFPGYSVNPFVQYQIAEKHGLVLGYQYAELQELFDYESNREFVIAKPNALVKQYVSSLTNNVLREEHKDTTAQASEYIRELKYNKYKLQTLQLSYAYTLSFKNKSQFEILLGGSYLIAVRGEGKRLDINDSVAVFNKSNPVFKNNQLALRLAVGYQYQLGKRTYLFTQLTGSKYFSNWELNSLMKTKPLIYGLRLGLKQGF